MNRVEEMKRMRSENGWTLQRIADEYKISKERVRQLIGNTGRNFRVLWTKSRIESGQYEHIHDGDYRELKTEDGVKSVLQEYWGKHRHVAKSGYPRIGQEFEERASNLLKQHGIENKLMPNHCPYDILTTSNIRIDVKSTRLDVSKMLSQKYTNPTFSVSHLKSGLDCDFFIIFIPDGEDFTFFVVPSIEFRHLKYGSSVRISWPFTRKSLSKWNKFHKKIDLLLS